MPSGGPDSCDPWIFCGVALALGLVTLFTGYVSARRATRVNPVQALRNDVERG
jgi:ABC-type lipoprotein release transport system permease subunit